MDTSLLTFPTKKWSKDVIPSSYTEDDLINAYKKGKSFYENAFDKIKEENIELAFDFSERVSKLLKKMKIKSPYIFLNDDNFGIIKTLVVINEDDFISDKYLKAINEIKSIRNKMKSSTFEVCCMGVPVKDSLNIEKIISDGYTICLNEKTRLFHISRSA